MLLDLCSDDRENARRWAVQTAVNKLLPDRRAFGEQVRAVCVRDVFRRGTSMMISAA
jgi:hypothetical protein